MNVKISDAKLLSLSDLFYLFIFIRIFLNKAPMIRFSNFTLMVMRYFIAIKVFMYRPCTTVMLYCATCSKCCGYSRLDKCFYYYYLFIIYFLNKKNRLPIKYLYKK